MITTSPIEGPGAFLLVIIRPFVGIGVKQAAAPIVAYTGFPVAGVALRVVPLALLYRRLTAVGHSACPIIEEA